MATDEKVLGIDLGTTNSGISIVEGGDAQMLKSHDGNRLTPSVVHYDEDGEALVGRRAINKEPAEPEQVIREIKRHMGEDGYTVEIAGSEYTPAEVSAEILKKLKRDAEEYLGGDVTEAVVTVPAYFTIDQTTATKEAAEAAGFEETHLLNEPTAAALAYGNGRDLNETMFVYDFGGGTLDISIIEVADDDYKVLATDGDNELGGRDFDRAMMELLVEEYDGEHEAELLDDPEIESNLRSEAEETKIDLSADEAAETLAPFLGQIEGDIISMEETVSRATFEAETETLREKAIAPVQNALDKAGLTSGDIDTILLVGGSTQMPAIQDQLQEHIGIEPTQTIDPDKIVAQGAAVYAQREIDTGYRCTDCGKEFDALVSLNEHYDESHPPEDGPDTDSDEIPCTHCDATFETEDERQAHQATEHPGIVDPEDGITDIISHSLGTKLEDGSMDVIIEDGRNKPATDTGMYTTTRDNQTRVPVGVYQGEHEMADENTKIGQVRLTDIPPRPAGEPRIEVTYNYDEDGTLHVEAEDVDTGDEIDGEFEI